ncbi:flagellar biosynthesis protein [Microbacterium sp. zg.Y625]|uniref:sugar-transfer associated ATP-grasp domain-containing protein n=1 Tax=Microbacterium jiangjiandongii TaxID=3049071 RepID=UPI00214BD5D6|nr:MULTISPECIES: sugar-transfer associated ATP-grasp domain-containing protein [unclassified Microbacterium]MCR2793240.1 flagellar biosynthesis protein [Microbacterium sp. zg.Y625]MCR2815583.1 flagellar biosynthesis protein [Microbacterium sp. zg.Y843]WIM25382.1 sugar-transfer associated ATP-grasp domain-containing protein [Microbacterium sp. zg-Y625]
MTSVPHLGPRLSYLAGRVLRVDVTSLLTRARAAASRHGRRTPAVVLDMLWQAGFRGVGFQDYIDYDFAILTREERATYMTNPVSNRLSLTFDDPAYRHVFHDKVQFNRTFDAHLHREWMVIEPGNAEALRTFALRHGTIVTKEPLGHQGRGVHRYHVATVDDWPAFHRGLLARGEILVEQVIRQHDQLAALCPGTVHTTRVTAFFDGETTHILAMAQKFGRGAVSDQNSFGGFYAMLDESGRATGAGYDSHNRVYETHPDSGIRISDFQLPMFDEVIAFVDRVARIVPQVRYVGWDIAVTPQGPVLVEGNWAAGVYENKPSATGIRTGHKGRYLSAINSARPHTRDRRAALVAA